MHHTAESWKKVSKELRGLHHTAEFDSRVCIILWSQAPQCSSHRRVSSLSIVCTDCKLYDCCFSVWPKDIIMKIILKVTNCPRNLFYFRRFCSTQGSLVTLISQKAQRCALCITPRSQAWQCASHGEVKLCGVHHTLESDSVVRITPQSHEKKYIKSAVCIIPRSQAP